MDSSYMDARVENPKREMDKGGKTIKGIEKIVISWLLVFDSCLCFHLRDSYKSL